MKNLKKTTAIVVVFAMLLSLVSVIGFAAGTNSVSYVLEVDKTQVKKGGVVNMSVYLKGASDEVKSVVVASGTAIVEYNAADFDAVDTTGSTKNGFDTTNVNAAQGTMTAKKSLSGSDASQNATVDTTKPIMTVSLTAKKDVTADTPITIKFRSGQAKGAIPEAGGKPAEFDSVSATSTVTITIAQSWSATKVDAITVNDLAIGTSEADVKAALANKKVTVKNDGGDKTAELAVANWALKSGSYDPLNVGPYTFEGDVVADDNSAATLPEGGLKATATVTLTALTDGELSGIPAEVTIQKKDKKTDYTDDQLIKLVKDAIKDGKIVIANADKTVTDEYAADAVAYAVNKDGFDDSVLDSKATVTVTVKGESANKRFNIADPGKTAEVTIKVVPAEIKDEKVASYKIDPTNIKPSTKLSLTVNRAETFADKDSKVTVDMYIVPAEGAEAQKVTVDKDVDKADMIMSKAVAGVQDNPGTTEDETVEAKEAELTKTFKLDSVTKYLTNAKAGDKIRFEVKLDGATIYVGEKAYTQKMLASNTSPGNRPGGVPSGNGSGTTTAKTFNIKTTESENGTFKVQATAKAGDVVTITTTPAEGFKTDKITVVKADKTNVPVDGKKFTMPSSDVTVSVTFVEGVEEDENNKPVSGDFTDVPSSHWAYQAVMNLKKLGIVNGNTETTFDPDGNVTRAEFAKMVAQLFSLKATATESAFTDCTASDWYTPYVIAATEAGYVKGMSEDFFGANEQISRQDICTVLGRALSGIPTPAAEMSFADADEIADYALEYVQAFVDLKIVNGYEDGTFKPAASATRAEAAKIIDGVTKLDNQAIKDAIAKLTGEAADEKTDAEADEKTDANADEKTDAEADEKTDANADEKTDAEADEKTDAKADEKTDAKAE